MATRSDSRKVGWGGWLAVSATLALIAGLAPTALEAGCISADLPAPVRVPGGEGFADGPISLCNVRLLSPVSSLYRFEVGGKPIGMLVTRHGTNEATADQRPVIVFTRDGDGRLTLAGFATPEGGHMATHFVAPFPAPGAGTELARSARRGAVDEVPLLAVRARRGAGPD